MTISSACSSDATSNARQFQASKGLRQQMQDFKSLAGALDSGDVKSAQDAFATLTKDLQNAQSNGKSSALLDPNSNLGKDFKALSDALQSGDAKSAQAAFDTLKKDVRSTHRARGHQHHKKADNDGDADDGGSSSTNGTTTPATSASTPQSGGLLNITG